MATKSSTTEPERSEHDTDPRLSVLYALLTRVERRLRLQTALALVPWALSAAGGAVLVLAVLRRFWGVPDPGELALAGAALVVLSLLAVGATALLRPRDALSTARNADHLLGLDERIATAIETASSAPGEPSPALLSLREAQLEDAVQSASAVHPERDIPVSVSRRRFAPPTALVLVVLAVLFVPDFLPGSNNAATAQVATEQKNIEILKEAVEAQPNAANDPNLQKLLQELSALSQDLKQGDLTKEEALARLSQTETDLQKALDPASTAQREALDQLAKQLSASGNQDAQKAGDALKNGDTQKAADALKQAANDASKMTADQRQALAASLEQARDSAAPLDPDLANRLNDAAQALQGSDANASQQALNNLAQQVQDNGQKLATQQQIEQALAQIQQSKTDIAQSGEPTPGISSGTVVAQGTPSSGTPGTGGTPFTGTPLSGTAVAQAQGSPLSGTPFSGTPIVLGSVTPVVVSGVISATGTPVLVQGTPGQGTPVLAQGQGQPSQSQGQSQGQGQTQGQGQGSGQGQGAGQGQGSGQGQGGGGQQSAPTGGWGTGHQEQVYAPPSSVQANLTPVTVHGQDNPNGEQSSAATNTDANNTGQSLVPYEQIYGQYQQQEGNALNSDYIPQGYKDLVKQYFTNIAP